MLKKTGSKPDGKEKEKSSKKGNKEKKDLKIDLEPVKPETTTENEQEEKFVTVGESDIKFLKEYGIISAENEKLIWEFFSSGIIIQIIHLKYQLPEQKIGSLNKISFLFANFSEPRDMSILEKCNIPTARKNQSYSDKKAQLVMKELISSQGFFFFLHHFLLWELSSNK